MLVTAKDLTVAEKVRLDRLRRGETQAQAADRWILSPAVYKRWETGALGRDRCPEKPPQIRRLKIGEQCMIARHRAGLSQAAVAQATGLCRYTVHRSERCKVATPLPLVTYWEAGR